MRLPNLNALRMFEAAARHLNFRLAAEELHLTQGAVAQQVRRLEADLGVRLFDRKPRGLALTATGRSYHASIGRALAIIGEATQKLRPDGSRITVSVTPSFATKWLVPRLGGFAARHPDIDIRTVASEGLADFRTDGVDIAVRQGRPPFGDGLRSEPLAPLDLCAVCSPALAARLGRVGQISDFAGHKLIEDAHGHWSALFQAAGLSAPGRMTQFNQTAHAMEAAANGQGIALAPRLLLRDDLAQAKLATVWKAETPGGFHIVYPSAARPSPARQAVIDWLHSEVEEAQAP